MHIQDKYTFPLFCEVKTPIALLTFTGKWVELSGAYLFTIRNQSKRTGILNLYLMRTWTPSCAEDKETVSGLYVSERINYFSPGAIRP